MGDEHDPFEGLTLDEDFVKGGVPEATARVTPAQIRRPEPPPPTRLSRSTAGRRSAPRRRVPLILGVSWVFVVMTVAFVGTAYASWRFNGSNVAVFGFVITGWLLSLTFHEFAHAAVAYLGGDRSVSSKGYLTLDVRRYVHPVLSFVLPVLFVILGGVGFPGGAVWIDQASLRSRAWRSAVSLAGPASNVVCAAGCLLPFEVMNVNAGHDHFWAGLAFLGLLQLYGAFLNLLPFPGLDGWHALEPYLPANVVVSARRLQPFVFLIVFFIVFSSPSVGGHISSFLESIEGRFNVPPDLAGYGYYLFKFWDT
jgi:Zn-dependent protease